MFVKPGWLSWGFLFRGLLFRGCPWIIPLTTPVHESSHNRLKVAVYAALPLGGRVTDCTPYSVCSRVTCLSIIQARKALENSKLMLTLPVSRGRELRSKGEKLRSQGRIMLIRHVMCYNIRKEGDTCFKLDRSIEHAECCNRQTFWSRESKFKVTRSTCRSP